MWRDMINAYLKMKKILKLRIHTKKALLCSRMIPIDYFILKMLNLSGTLSCKKIKCKQMNRTSKRNNTQEPSKRLGDKTSSSQKMIICTHFWNKKYRWFSKSKNSACIFRLINAWILSYSFNTWFLSRIHFCQTISI